MYTVAFGFTIFLSTIIPTTYVSKMLLGGMYSPFFKQFSHSAYISLNLFLSLLVPLIIAIVFIKKAEIMKRLPKPIPGSTMLLLGGFFILAPQILQIFTSMVPGGGASFSLMIIAAPFILFAKVFLYIGIVQLLMAIKPNEKYVYQE